MRLARLVSAAGPRNVVWREGRWHGIVDLFAAEPTFTGETFEPDAALLAPVQPRVIVGMSHNSGAEGRALPPQAFLKSVRTAVGPGDPVMLDPARGSIVAEGELAIVMGRFARRLTAEQALGAVLGYTVANDVTAVDQVAFDDKLTQAKNGDGFTPLGPWIETELDPWSCGITVEVGGRIAAAANTDALAYDVVEQLVYLTSIMTLGPGDIVLTGSPDTSAPVASGDRVGITDRKSVV